MTAPKMLPMAFLFGKGHLQPFVDFAAKATYCLIDRCIIILRKNIKFL